MILRDTQPTKTWERKHLHSSTGFFFLRGEPLRRSKRSSCKAQSLEGSQHPSCPLIWQVESMGECWMYFVWGVQVVKWSKVFDIYSFFDRNHSLEATGFGGFLGWDWLCIQEWGTNTWDFLSTSGVLFWWPPGSGNWPNMQGKECDSRSHCDLNVTCALMYTHYRIL